MLPYNKKCQNSLCRVCPESYPENTGVSTDSSKANILLVFSIQCKKVKGTSPLLFSNGQWNSGNWLVSM
ncbi:hypothetical protein XENTR_v10020415 [Xenopus tropicalis]|nr:hypothetical protein XENTR_v10020415 [Xenopus tropicalis]